MIVHKLEVEKVLKEAIELWMVGKNIDIQCNTGKPKKKEKKRFILDLPGKPWSEALNLHMNEAFGQHLVQWPLHG